MSLIERIFRSNKEQRSAPTLIQGRKDLVQKDLYKQVLGKTNGEFNIKNAELISTVYTCISILANNVSRLPLNIYKEDEKTKGLAQNHKYFSTLKYNPQVIYSYQQWISTIITHLYLRGNAYAIIKGNEFQIIHPDLISDIKIIDGELWYYSKDLMQVFYYKDILHFKLISKDGKIGLNPIESLKTELNIQYKSEKTVDSFYSNNANTTKYLQPIAGQGTTNDKILELVNKFKESYGGYSNAGDLVVVPPLFELKELSINYSDMQFLESAKYTESSIGALYGIPGYMLGKGDYTGKFEEQALHFKNNTLASLLNIISSELEFKLLSIDEKQQGYCIDFDIKKLVESNLVDKANVYKLISMMGGLTPNQVAKDFGLPQSDNPAMDKHYMQMQYYAIEDGNRALLPTQKQEDVLQSDNNN